MMKSILLAIFVLGIAQALVFPVQNSSKQENSNENYEKNTIASVEELSEVNHEVTRVINELKAATEMVADMNNTSVNETTIDKSDTMLNTVENGLDSIESAMNDGSVKNAWKNLCTVLNDESKNDLTESLVNATELVGQEKSFIHKACSEKTYKKMQDFVKKAKQFTKSIKALFQNPAFQRLFQNLKKSAKAISKQFTPVDVLKTVAYMIPGANLIELMPKTYWDKMKEGLRLIP